MRVILLTLVLLAAVVVAQQAGTLTPEVHPSLPMQSCTSAGCTTLSTSVVLDANWRWLHNTGGSSNCYTGNQWDSTYCPNPSTCAAQCALEGVDSATYLGTYGISTSGTALSQQFVTQGPYSKNVGSRVYLAENVNTYKMFHLKNREFAFDVDVSELPCGLNGALYFVEMSADGGLSEYSGNNAGAKFGTGYCDAQCPHDIKFINGEANTIGWGGTNSNSGQGQYGSCCAEMDIWESNSISTAYTPHPCTVIGQTRCSGINCGDDSQRYEGVCDKDGCDFNSYRMGDTTFYGPNKIIDTTQPMTVVTQFITEDGTDDTDLVEIRRYYKQGGVVYANSASVFSGLNNSNSISDGFCSAQKSLFGDTNDFSAKGGMAAMGHALDRGMVLVMSLWDDHAVNLLWLDSNYPTNANPATPGVARGSCPTSSGVPAEVEANHPDSTVVWSNIKIGTIGSTTPGITASSTSATNTITTAPSSSSSGSNVGTTTGSASTSGSASTTGSAPCTPGTNTGSLAVYTDSLQNGFSDYSWSTDYSLSASENVRTGLYAIKFAVQGYEAVYFHTSATFALSTYAAIQFYVFATSTIASNNFAVLLYDHNANQVGSVNFPVSAAANVWTTITIPLSSFGASVTTQVSGFSIQGVVSASQGYVWVDDVSFVAAYATSTTATAATSTTAATTATTSAATTAATTATTAATTATSAATTATTAATTATSAATSAATTATTAATTAATSAATTATSAATTAATASTAATTASTSAATTATSAATTTAAATTAATVSTATTATATTGTGDCDASSIQITQVAGNAWVAGGIPITQYAVTISTTCTTKTLTALSLSLGNWEPISGGVWGFVVSGTTGSLPSYASITATSPYTSFGYQNQYQAATFTVLSYTFQ